MILELGGRGGLGFWNMSISFWGQDEKSWLLFGFRFGQTPVGNPWAQGFCSPPHVTLGGTLLVDGFPIGSVNTCKPACPISPSGACL